MEKVNHPEYYNQHPSGVECIDIIRHYCFSVGCAIKYLWRVGLKTEEGLTSKEKEIEDLEKAKWDIETEDGRKARLVNCGLLKGSKPLCVIIDKGDAEEPVAYTWEGRYYTEGTSPADLIMVKYEKE